MCGYYDLMAISLVFLVLFVVKPWLNLVRAVRRFQLHVRIWTSFLGLFFSKKLLMLQSSCWTCSSSRKTDFKDTWTRRTETLFRECWGWTLCVKWWVDEGKATKETLMKLKRGVDSWMRIRERDSSPHPGLRQLGGGGGSEGRRVTGSVEEWLCGVALYRVWIENWMGLFSATVCGVFVGWRAMERRGQHARNSFRQRESDWQCMFVFPVSAFHS